MLQGAKQYFIDSFQELGKVTWPTKKRAVNICILVVSFVIVAAAFIAGIDFAFNKGYNYLLEFAPPAPIETDTPAVDIESVETSPAPEAPASAQ